MNLALLAGCVGENKEEGNRLASCEIHGALLPLACTHRISFPCRGQCCCGLWADTARRRKQNSYTTSKRLSASS